MAKRRSVYGEIAEALTKTDGSSEAAGAVLLLQGMRWTEQGARHMAALRADLFNDRWERRTSQVLAA